MFKNTFGGIPDSVLPLCDNNSDISTTTEKAPSSRILFKIKNLMVLAHKTHGIPQDSVRYRTFSFTENKRSIMKAETHSNQNLLRKLYIKINILINK